MVLAVIALIISISIIISLIAHPKLRFKIGEFIFMGVSPIYGLVLTPIFNKELEFFNLEYYPTLIIFTLIPYLAYWFSRYDKSKFSLVSLTLAQYGILSGVGLYALLFFQFFTPLTLLGLAIFPYFAFPLFAPAFAIYYSIKELKSLRDHLDLNLEHRAIKNIDTDHSFLFANKFIWNRNITNFKMLYVFTFSMVILMMFFKQPMHSLFLLIDLEHNFLLEFLFNR